MGIFAFFTDIEADDGDANTYAYCVLRKSVNYLRVVFFCNRRMHGHGVWWLACNQQYAVAVEEQAVKKVVINNTGEFEVRAGKTNLSFPGFLL